MRQVRQEETCGPLCHLRIALPLLHRAFVQGSLCEWLRCATPLIEGETDRSPQLLYTLPSHINCVPVTSETTTYDLPLSRKLFLDYSLTSGTTTIAHGDSNTTTTTAVQLTFKDITEADNVLFCTGTFKRGVGVGVYTKDKHAKLPKVLETVITIPEGDGPTVKFGAKRASKCAGHAVRTVLKWKKGQEEEQDK